MTVVIEHARHRVSDRLVPGTVLSLTACGRRFVGLWLADRNTRHHEPARGRCSGCYTPGTPGR